MEARYYCCGRRRIETISACSYSRPRKPRLNYVIPPAPMYVPASRCEVSWASPPPRQLNYRNCHQRSIPPRRLLPSPPPPERPVLRQCQPLFSHRQFKGTNRKASSTLHLALSPPPLCSRPFTLFVLLCLMRRCAAACCVFSCSCDYFLLSIYGGPATTTISHSPCGPPMHICFFLLSVNTRGYVKLILP